MSCHDRRPGDLLAEYRSTHLNQTYAVKRHIYVYKEQPVDDVQRLEVHETREAWHHDIRFGHEATAMPDQVSRTYWRDSNQQHDKRVVSAHILPHSEQT